jgi:hypothetical protein
MTGIGPADVLGLPLSSGADDDSGERGQAPGADHFAP